MCGVLAGLRGAITRAKRERVRLSVCGGGGVSDGARAHHSRLLACGREGVAARPASFALWSVVSFYVDVAAGLNVAIPLHFHKIECRARRKRHVAFAFVHQARVFCTRISAHKIMRVVIFADNI